ncbi:DEAD/DEAH box helicase [Bartonella henselae]|uniref:DEAD/DEAH box helicase n=1 Tax=Bartonella henselae TaxID=38323 RepID=UPI0025AAB198|nr:type ISP restriction/modification enzyme [Bartonella henselae]MDM9983461.1 DEAD/DEAH box helicase family protein [Bartonella henselae]MDM9984396.1 DEAD/DEAH box helicase family protein [Bartonella henselae]MDM9985831.1 DEAD/DEAH box helicase family protein [Bartonella henselae]MDM9988077.1 DEAD/DEAH box helicase family protein [Bartonella henselae]MDM9988786.1 DEAD/DEAH box helicase family protein [Bartonella henselae]
MTLQSLLQIYRDEARTERDKGTYFERFALAYLMHDPLQFDQYEKVQTFKDWAYENGWDGRDTGIDLVAKLRNEDGFAAIQCKFYDAAYRIKKADIDSFISASGKAPFKRRVIIDSTKNAWSENAETMIRGQDVPVIRINLSDMQESPIRWEAFTAKGKIVLEDKKKLRPHQVEALHFVRAGLTKADRGKLIMACGTGKTFTSLKIAEDLAGEGKFVLFLVPSLALMSQTVREWTTDTEIRLRSFAVCSDTQVGKRRKNTHDIAEIDVFDLAFPATTDAAKLAKQAKNSVADKMTVVFATYQSIQVIADAQKKYGLPTFDLIICDEAHRTTGATLVGEDESNFVKVHSNDVIRAKKRLYMTATPRIFGDNAKSRANEANVVLASMDDEKLFGKTLFYRGFSWAVQNNLLTDYKVIVLAMDEKLVSSAVQKRLSDDQSELVLDDATKIIGCYKALTKQDMKADIQTDPYPMHRALAFCKDIRSSKLVRDEFSAVVKEYLDYTNREDTENEPFLQCEIEHVDGTCNAKDRGVLLDWMKADSGDGVCRILTNARCLSEGVDVPALDAIMFLNARKSQIDVVQSVGRVMRRSEGKKMGYVILPIGIPSGTPVEQALNNNDKYRVIWQILNALRAHDDRFDATINKASLGQDVSNVIEIIGVTQSMELQAVTAVVDNLPVRSQPARSGIGASEYDLLVTEKMQGEFSFSVDELSRAIMAKIVKKCGTRDYWEDWASNIAQIAKNHITRLTGILAEPDTKARQAFDRFVAELRDDLNDTITESDAIEMLAQHLITRPVFQVLFEGYQFTRENPVSRAMQRMLDVLDEANLDKESKDLEKFYASVKLRASGITDPQAKQRLIIELYDKFFRYAFPRTVEKLGIVYTPVEIVDFILRSVNDVLQAEFGQTLGAPGIHIMDPFTGTGTFITRLLQSGLITPEEMKHKFCHEIHANEIVLLAYYIAAINIETTYHGLIGGDYVPFEGICLTDTFQLYEQEKDLISDLLVDNSTRRSRQKGLDIRVIVGNPPYSSGQKSENDNAKNIGYPKLDRCIRETYAAQSKASNVNGLYDSYIRAIRWASDRIKDCGVIGFVTNAGFINGYSTNGLRKELSKEFSNIYVLNLRGDIRKNMMSKGRAQEGQNVFGSGSMTGIAVTLFVKNPDVTEHCKIYYHDIGDNLTTKEKLCKLQHLGSIGGIKHEQGWQMITPDEHGDWLDQRNNDFEKFLALGDKKGSNIKLFETFSCGIQTNRDAWVYNSSRKALAKNMSHMIAFYNSEVERFNAAHLHSDRKTRAKAVNDFVNTDSRKISWSSSLKEELIRGKFPEFESDCIVQSIYRPFKRQWLYYNRIFNHRVYQMPRIFPMGQTVGNRVIQVTGVGASSGFSVLMTKDLSNLHTMDTGQCFPRYVYENAESLEDKEGDHVHLFANFAEENKKAGLQRRDALTNEGLAYFKAAYPSEMITKDDLFYYVYGILHSEDYRARYAHNLSKQLPRIPTVKKVEDFWAFVTAGRKLGDLHMNYEEVEPYPVTYKQGDPRTWMISDAVRFYRVEAMKFSGKRGAIDKSTVIYNANITMQNIPLEAYDYVVNGRPALEWVMERQIVKTDKASGLVNDANRYAVETVGNPAYPLELFQRVITVSLETIKIVRSLPKLEVRETEDVKLSIVS